MKKYCYITTIFQGGSWVLFFPRWLHRTTSWGGSYVEDMCIWFKIKNMFKFNNKNVRKMSILRNCGHDINFRWRTSLTTGEFLICLARCPYFNVDNVSRNDDSEEDTQHNMTVSQFPPRASFNSSVKLLKKNNKYEMWFEAFLVGNYMFKVNNWNTRTR